MDGSVRFIALRVIRSMYVLLLARPYEYRYIRRKVIPGIIIIFLVQGVEVTCTDLCLALKRTFNPSMNWTPLLYIL
jgi:hypothetical protein